MKVIALTAALAASAFVAMPAAAQPAPDDSAAAQTGLPADSNYNSNVGVTHDTAHEAENDLSNGRTVDRNGQPNTTAETIRSQQRHAMGERDR